jgi:CubicO group peptidase (beta-lactamase class C family)
MMNILSSLSQAIQHPLRAMRLLFPCAMKLLLNLMLLPGSSRALAEPVLPGVSVVVAKSIKAQDIAGAVTMVVTKDQILHLEAAGFADIEKQRAMEPQTLFWIASMTKSITATAVLLLQDEGRLKVTDSVAKYIPEFAELKTPPAARQILRSRNFSRVHPD